VHNNSGNGRDKNINSLGKKSSIYFILTWNLVAYIK
jgi:hypothetical protein